MKSLNSDNSSCLLLKDLKKTVLVTLLCLAVLLGFYLYLR